jgi:hypothetical protein
MTAIAIYREGDMKSLGRYDSALQMFVEEPREPDLARLTFLRWLAERGRLDRGPAGAPSGEFATRAAGADRCADELRAA